MTLPVGDHGGDGAAVARHLGVPVARAWSTCRMSLNPVAPDVAPIVAAHAGEVGRYPEPAAATAALAAAIGVPVERVVLTNGGAEAIALVAAELGAGEVVDPEFSLYRRHLAEVGAGRRALAVEPVEPARAARRRRRRRGGVGRGVLAARDRHVDPRRRHGRGGWGR